MNEYSVDLSIWELSAVHLSTGLQKCQETLYPRTKLRLGNLSWYKATHKCFASKMPATIPRLSFLPDFPGRDRLYRPLDTDKTEIRVIAIMPSTERSAPIRCSLRTISIRARKGANHYHALSYYWGSTTDLENIEIFNGSLQDKTMDRFAVPVTSQLTGALRQFRARMTVLGSPSFFGRTLSVSINWTRARDHSRSLSCVVFMQLQQVPGYG